MYFSNISDTELVKYPRPLIDNFTIRLSDILHKTDNLFDNKLFKIEEIITDTIFKIYPLFSCKEISTSNNNDKIFENKLIICKKEEKETFITFKSNDGEITDYLDYASYYSIDDELTVSQFNAIVSLLRKTPINKQIRIQPHTIGTDYGDLDFEFTGLILDNGIKVTELTTLKVKLSEQVFWYSNYHLNLEVLRLGDPNVEIDDASEKTIIPLSIDLLKDTWVDIDTTNLEIGDIILYDGVLEITHDKPEIHYLTGLNTYATPNPIQNGENSEIYAQLIDSYGYNHKEVGKTVYFFEIAEPTIKVSATEDIIQTGDTVEVNAEVKDYDGSIIKNTKVYFYKEEEEE